VSAPANGKLMGAKLIEQLANPASIAIVGASSDLTSTSGRPLAHLLNYGYPGRIVPINPKRDEVGGVQTVHRVNEIEPGSVDVAMVLLAAPPRCRRRRRSRAGRGQGYHRHRKRRRPERASGAREGGGREWHEDHWTQLSRFSDDGVVDLPHHVQHRGSPPA
jgi:hypothetical protein